MNRFQEMSCLLNEQLKIHNKLLELETRKTGVLIKGDVKALDELVTMQQPYIMSANNFEKQREKLQSEMGLSGVSLREIIQDYPEAGILAKHFSEVSNVLTSLKKVCGKNRKILGAKLDVINAILTKTGVANDKEVTYSNVKKT